jgi:hypothetical protein
MFKEETSSIKHNAASMNLIVKMNDFRIKVIGVYGMSSGADREDFL